MYKLENLYSLEQIKQYNSEHGFYFFSPDTLRFFNSKVYPGFIHTPAGVVFITSEKFDYRSPRLYTVRVMVEDGSVNEFAGCEFQQFPTIRAARKFARIEADKLNEVR
jgi:hypothetical protein